jgi:hypothetical protein
MLGDFLCGNSMIDDLILFFFLSVHHYKKIGRDKNDIALFGKDIGSPTVVIYPFATWQ